MDKLANIFFNSPSQKLVPYHTSPSRPSIALPSYPGHPASPVLIDGKFEDPLVEKQAHHETGKEFFNGGRCPYIFAQ